MLVHSFPLIVRDMAGQASPLHFCFRIEIDRALCSFYGTTYSRPDDVFCDGLPIWGNNDIIRSQHVPRCRSRFSQDELSDCVVAGALYAAGFLIYKVCDSCLECKTNI